MNKRKTGTATTLDPSRLQLLAVPDVARLLSVGRSTVYELMNAGEIEAVKVLNARRVLVVSVQQYIDRQKKVG